MVGWLEKMEIKSTQHHLCGVPPLSMNSEFCAVSPPLCEHLNTFSCAVSPPDSEYYVVLCAVSPPDSE